MPRWRISSAWSGSRPIPWESTATASSPSPSRSRSRARRSRASTCAGSDASSSRYRRHRGDRGSRPRQGVRLLEQTGCERHHACGCRFGGRLVGDEGHGGLHMVDGDPAIRNPLTLDPGFGYLSGLWLRNIWWCGAPASTTSRTSPSPSPGTGSPSSPGSPARGSLRSRSTPSTPKGSAGTSSRCRRTPGSSSG